MPAPRFAGIYTARKTANQDASALAYADITGLGFQLNSATQYGFDYEIIFTSESTANGLGFAVNGPSSATLTYSVQIQNNASNPATGTNTMGAAWQMRGNTTYDAMTAIAGLAAAANQTARLRGMIVTSGAPGTLIPRVRSETTGLITILAGSWGILI